MKENEFSPSLEIEQEEQSFVGGRRKAICYKSTADGNHRCRRGLLQVAGQFKYREYWVAKQTIFIQNKRFKNPHVTLISQCHTAGQNPKRVHKRRIQSLLQSQQNQRKSFMVIRKTLRQQYGETCPRLAYDKTHALEITRHMAGNNPKGPEGYSVKYG
ncbi:hypothetical protein EVAR_32705_1 [Eumeta japonica]|uniref:Uncharacterized protein n=1 Tax=Eumeta variegata TaxID=151549 RepID=A0A4C1VQJ6_EUMVA|nr:hypothetical protein EVAR_32705_1 [Eumeta japonica]